AIASADLTTRPNSYRPHPMDTPTESWWTPQQLTLVEDRNRVWRRAGFEPSDMILFDRGPGQGSIGRQLKPDEHASPGCRRVKGGCTHAHSDLCGTTLSKRKNDQHDGYTDGRDWLCISCFERFVAPRL